MHRHAERFIGLERLGTPFSYERTYDYEGPYIDREHARIAQLPLENGLCIILPSASTGQRIPGWLQPADALKLYEMAYFSEGDVLEIGSYQGLSTVIMATALERSPRPGRHIHSVDLDPSCTQMTLEHVAQNVRPEVVTTSTEDGAAAVRRLADQQRDFGFAFIDHSHAFEPVLEVCRQLHRVMKPGAFVLFHDYNDPQNRTGEYGVYQGVAEGLAKEHFDFYGIYGCAALYRKQP